MSLPFIIYRPEALHPLPRAYFAHMDIAIGNVGVSSPAVNRAFEVIMRAKGVDEADSKRGRLSRHFSLSYLPQAHLCSVYVLYLGAGI